MAKDKIKTMDLPVRLTPDQQRQRGLELADCHGAMRVLEEEQKSTKGRWKKQSEEIEVNMARLSRIVQKGEECRPVAVSESENWAEKTVEIIREDTGEQVHYRAMSEHELQQQIPGT